MDTVMGVESEYAVAIDGGCALNHGDVAHRLYNLAAQTAQHLTSVDGDRLYLRNGGCIYVDYGDHLEYASPECSNPTDLVRYVRAGDAIMSDLTARLSTQLGARIAASRGNIGYNSSPENCETWASHESYLSALSPINLVEGLVPFLCSRIIFCGGGGFDPFNKGVSFSLSPRTTFISEVSSGESTCSRGIVHLKDEPLSNHGHRLHLICGDALGSELAMWLRAGTTALIVRLLELGFAAPAEIVPRDPINALRVIASDPTLTAQIPTMSGRKVTALDIQHVYLRAIEISNHEDFPVWAPKIVQGWRRILELLASGPQEAATALDWPIKLQLYNAFCARRGISWETLSDRNSSRLSNIQAIRLQLFELETQFLQIGGLFDQMESAGVLEHGALDNRDAVAQAVQSPPRGTRAQVRGECVAQFSGSNSVTCSWSRITDTSKRLTLSLDDPLSTSVAWQRYEDPTDDEDEESPQGIVASLRRTLSGRHSSIRPSTLARLAGALRQESIGLAIELRSLALASYCNGHYRQARSLLQLLLNAGFEMPSTLCHLARVALMTDNATTALRHASRAWRLREQGPDYVVCRILWLQIAAILLNAAGSHSLQSLIGKFKTAILEAYSYDWNLTPLLAHLQRRMSGQDHEFLSAMAAAINDHNKLPALDEFPAWTAAALEALD